MILYNWFSTCLQASSSLNSFVALQQISGLCGLVAACYKLGISEGELAVPLAVGLMSTLQLLKVVQKTAKKGILGKDFLIKQTPVFVIRCQRTQMHLVNLA